LLDFLKFYILCIIFRFLILMKIFIFRLYTNIKSPILLKTINTRLYWTKLNFRWLYIIIIIWWLLINSSSFYILLNIFFILFKLFLFLLNFLYYITHLIFIFINLFLVNFNILSIYLKVFLKSSQLLINSISSSFLNIISYQHK
jgi:hypothetical protein